MSAPPRACLVHALLTACDDAFFAITAAARLDPDALRALARRRSAALEAVARGAPAEHAGQGDAWVVRLSAAIAPIAPPRWMAMADLIEEGLSLEHGARGVRSWFTSKPSEKDAARVRSQGAFAVRALGAVLGVPEGEQRALSPEARLQQCCLAASLGLPEDEQRALLAEPPAAVEALALPADLAPRLARAALRGAFFAVTLEGADARAEQAVLVLGRRTGLPAEEVTAAAGEGRRAAEATRAFGAPAADALRYVLEGEGEAAEALATAAARLSLPAGERRAVVEAARAGAPVGLARKHAVDRKQREAVLGLAWAAALRGDPSTARRIDLAARHDQVAADLGEEGAGREARRAVEAFVEETLAPLVPLVP